MKTILTFLLVLLSVQAAMAEDVLTGERWDRLDIYESELVSMQDEVNSCFNRREETIEQMKVVAAAPNIGLTSEKIEAQKKKLSATDWSQFNTDKFCSCFYDKRREILQRAVAAPTDAEKAKIDAEFDHHGQLYDCAEASLGAPAAAVAVTESAPTDALPTEESPDIAAWRADARASLADLTSRSYFCKAHRDDEIGIIESAVRVESAGAPSNRSQDVEAGLTKIKASGLSNLDLNAYCDCKYTRMKAAYQEYIDAPADQYIQARILESVSRGYAVSVACAGAILP